MNTVKIVGAGPGDPDLITVKGRNALAAADIIVYAGSLVNPALLAYAPGAKVYDSAGLNLDEVIEIIRAGYGAGKEVVRLHTGDPSIYGAIREQMDRLKDLEIPYEVVPGVSSFAAAAAALKQELVLPGVTQTIVLTRMEGRTPVPDRENIAALAKIKATMVIFLSVHMIEDLVAQLCQGYGADTPVAVVYKASWPEEKKVTGTLADIASKVKAEKIGKTALVMVGGFLGDAYALSKLYDKHFSHGHRQGTES